MAFIAENFRATNRAIQAKLDAKEVPTPEIISHILRDQTAKAQGLLRKQSSQLVHTICISGFATVSLGKGALGEGTAGNPF